MAEDIAFNPASDEFAQNPHAAFRRLRQAGSILPESAESPLTGRTFTRWNLLDYADVLLMFRDERFVNELVSSDEAAAPIPESVREYIRAQHNMMLFRDPPDHTRLRSLVNKAFTPRMVQQLEPRIQSLTDDLLAPYESGQSFDAADVLAFPLPVMVIADMLGVPREDRDLVKRWSTVFAQTLDIRATMETYAAGNHMVIEFRDYFRQIVADRTKSPQDDLMSALVRVVDQDGDRLSEDELLDMGILLLVAGHETTRNLIANELILLAQHPGATARLRTSPDLIPAAVEEALRCEPPVMVTTRIVRDDMDFGGHHLKRGDIATAWICAANRDPQVFPDPDAFDVSRANNRHLAFAQGIHYCLGAPLARLEGAIALRAVLDRYPTFQLARPPVWKPSTFRAPLAVALDTAER